jgi:hypothetical protein
MLRYSIDTFSLRARPAAFPVVFRLTFATRAQAYLQRQRSWVVDSSPSVCRGHVEAAACTNGPATYRLRIPDPTRPGVFTTCLKARLRRCEPAPEVTRPTPPVAHILLTGPWCTANGPWPLTPPSGLLENFRACGAVSWPHCQRPCHRASLCQTSWPPLAPAGRHHPSTGKPPRLGRPPCHCPLLPAPGGRSRGALSSSLLNILPSDIIRKFESDLIVICPWSIDPSKNSNRFSADLLRCIEAEDKRKGSRKAPKELGPSGPNCSVIATAKIVGTSETNVKRARSVISDAEERKLSWRGPGVP